MKKKRTSVLLAFFMLLLFAIFLFKELVYFRIEPSPTDEYELITFMIDEGGAGYDGAYFVKEKGLFSKWHKITTGTCSCEWLSETEFEVYRSGSRTKHSVDEFFGE